MEKRHLKKIEFFENEIEFINNHSIEDDVTERALLYSLQKTFFGVYLRHR